MADIKYLICKNLYDFIVHIIIYASGKYLLELINSYSLLNYIKGVCII